MANSVISNVKSYLLKGLVVLVPLIITVLVLSVALGFLTDIIQPITDSIESLVGQNLPSSASTVIAFLSLGVIVFLVGFLTELLPTAQKLTEVIHALIESIPGIGSVYSSFRKMSDTVIKGENSFRDVVVVQYPSDNTYTLAFVTSKSNSRLNEIAGEPTTTVFIPMAPNPFMGGFITNIPDSKLHQIDITVQEGAKAFITSGVTLGDNQTTDEVELDEELNQLQEKFTGDEENK
jgi:uncharacterized membrane protein